MIIQVLLRDFGSGEPILGCKSFNVGILLSVGIYILIDFSQDLAFH